jgi:gliding motility-associated transport system permease protein
MRQVWNVCRRELQGYFTTPVAYVFIVVFLALAGGFTFYYGKLFENGQAELGAFFGFLPWFYLFLMPAISMRLWAEERKTGTLELLLTLPIGMGQAVVGKFLAAWIFAGVALALTFPLWLTVAYLGDPDHGVIVAQYAGGLLLAGGFLAIGSAVSALTKNQVIAFVISVVIGLGFLLIATAVPLLNDARWIPPALVDAFGGFSFLAHFESIAKGVLDARDLVYFGSLIALALFANVVFLENRKSA